MKKEINKDYWNYDYLDLTVKKDKVDELISTYNSFRWEQTDMWWDKQYSDIIHLSFKRQHKIENKDRLQYLQVKYENLLNEDSFLLSRRHAKSQAVISISLVFGVSALLGFLSLIFLIKSTLSIVFGSILVLAQAIISVYLFRRIRNLRKKEKQNYKEKSQDIKLKIDGIIAEAKLLAGVNEDEKV